MPREGIAYHVDDLWRERVVERLTELAGRSGEKRNQSWLADASGCPRSMVSELLSGERQQSTYLPEIHAALGWDPPLGPLLSQDDEEILRVARRLTPEQRARLLERALTLEEDKKRR